MILAKLIQFDPDKSYVFDMETALQNVVAPHLKRVIQEEYAEHDGRPVQITSHGAYVDGHGVNPWWCKEVTK